jgi:hypothetical protein
MGKLPEFFFKIDGTANVNQKAKKIFRIVFVLLSFVPMALIVFSIIEDLLLYKTILLAATLVFSLYNGIVRRKTLLASTRP